MREKIYGAVMKAVHPPCILRAALILAGFGFLIMIFCFALEDSALAYIAYLLSAYALLLAAAWGRELFKRLKIKKQTLMERHTVLKRYAEDRYFRVSVGMTVSFFVNLLYAGLKAVSALLYASAWTGLVAAYYLVLSLARLYLMTRFLKWSGRDRQREIICYRRTAVFMLFINMALTAIIYRIVQEGETYTYPGTVIFAYAAYTFYSFGMSVYNMVIYRRFKSPLLSAAKAIGMTTALASVVSLQSAMLTRFDAAGSLSHSLSNGLTGMLVCATILLISLLMLVRSGRMEKELRKEEAA